MPDEHSPEIAQIVRRVRAAGVLIRPSDLDLLVFFARHPRSLLSSESLAAFLGYELKDIADSLEALLGAGILRRRQSNAHAARLYELVADGPSEGGWLEPLLALARTRPGRLALLKEIARHTPSDTRQSRATKDASRPGPRRLVAPQPRATKETKTG